MKSKRSLNGPKPTLAPAIAFPAGKFRFDSGALLSKLISDDLHEWQRHILLSALQAFVLCPSGKTSKSVHRDLKLIGARAFVRKSIGYRIADVLAAGFPAIKDVLHPKDALEKMRRFVGAQKNADLLTFLWRLGGIKAVRAAGDGGAMLRYCENQIAAANNVVRIVQVLHRRHVLFLRSGKENTKKVVKVHGAAKFAAAMNKEEPKPKPPGTTRDYRIDGAVKKDALQDSWDNLQKTASLIYAAHLISDPPKSPDTPSRTLLESMAIKPLQLSRSKIIQWFGLAKTVEETLLCDLAPKYVTLLDRLNELPRSELPPQKISEPGCAKLDVLLRTGERALRAERPGTVAAPADIPQEIEFHNPK